MTPSLPPPTSAAGLPSRRGPSTAPARVLLADGHLCGADPAGLERRTAVVDDRRRGDERGGRPDPPGRRVRRQPGCARRLRAADSGRGPVTYFDGWGTVTSQSTFGFTPK